MSKKSKETRPAFKCHKCGARWISDEDPICTWCHIQGIPMNDSAERLIDEHSTNNKQYFKEVHNG